MTFREGILATSAVVALMALQLIAIDGFSLLSRNFWVDELYTYAIVADPSLAHALRAIHGGMDSMPTYALLMRLLSIPFGDPSEVFLRSGSLGFIVLAMVGVYVLLRRAVAPAAAFAGALAVWAHPLVLTHAFDARFHGPFLAAAVWFCLAIDRRQTRPNERRTGVGLALAALALCAIHLFGVVVWAIVLAASAVVFRRWRALWPALAGPVVLPGLWWLALGPQRAAVTIKTWEPEFSWSRAADTAGYVLVPEYLAAVFLLIWGVLCVRWMLTGGRAATPPAAAPPSALILLTTLSVLVPALVVLSLLIQPALTPRYAIAAIAALAPAVAWGVARLPRWGAVVIMAALIVTSTNVLRRHANQARWQDQQTDAMITVLRELPGNDPVVFEVAHGLDVMWRYAPDLRSRLVLLDFEIDDVPHPSPMRIVSRDLARAYRRFFDGPRQATWQEVRSWSSFYVVPDPRAYSVRPGADNRYTGFTVTAVGPQVAIAARH